MPVLRGAEAGRESHGGGRNQIHRPELRFGACGQQGCCAAGTARVAVRSAVGMLTAVAVPRAPLSPGISASASLTVTLSAMAIVLS